MKHVACYCRVSTDEQKKYGFSIQAQKDALEKYCKENNYKYEFYIDEGISASSMKKRKALNEMLKKLDSFDMILFTKLDRLSRNVLDANTINKMLIENKCTMKAIDEDDIDTSTADGTFIFNLKVSLAQREIGKTSERIKFVFENKRKKGEITSGQKKYGYDIVDRHYVINQKEADNIIKLYEYFISVGGSIAATYKYFVQHFENKGRDALSLYLRNTSYIGKYKLYRKNIYIDNYIPRIMDDELFYTVQRLLKKNEKSSKRTTEPSIFSGIIYCTTCNSRMSKKKDNRVKSRLIRYSCDNASRYKLGTLEKKCTNNILIREENIESYLLENIQKIAKEYISSNEIVANKKPIDNTKEIRNLENKIYKLKNLYLYNLIDKNTYKNDYDKFTKELQKLKDKNVITIQKDFSKLKNFINQDINTIYEKLDINEKRILWISFIDKIYVEEGKIKEIIFL